MTTRRRAGNIHTKDIQEDIYQGQYQLVRCVGRNRWVVVDLPPSEELCERVLDYVTSPGAYLGGNTPDDEYRCEIAARIERAGQEHEVTFISEAKYAEYF